MGVRIVEPVPAFARLKNTTAAGVRRIYHAPGRVAFTRRLASLPGPMRDGIRLNFGWIDAPAREEETRIGGGVKLGHLRERFGEDASGFNVLYLVSSVLHLVPHAEELVAWARARGVPVVWNQNGVAYPGWCGESYPWFNEPMRRLIAQADHVVYQSAFCRDCAERYLGPSTAPWEILWNPVDERFFAPSDAPPAGDPWRLLAMGTNHAFYRVKASLDTLAVLLRRGIPVSLLIAGEFRWKDGDREVADYIAGNQLGDHVSLHPRFSQAEAPSIYRRAHVLLHPKYNDPCPTVPIEAMACGLPVVGSRSGGMPELVPAEAGRLVDVPQSWTREHTPTAEQMADAVAEIFSNLALHSQGARSHAVKSFSRGAWVDRHEQIFRTVMGGS